MKKSFLTFASLIVLVSMLAACANPSEETGDKITPGAEGSIKTDTIATTVLPESEKTSQTTEETTVHTSDVETSAPDENIDLALNMDLIEEYGMSFGELKAKHGKLVGYETPDGDGVYILENGYGKYWFYTDLNPDNFVTHTEGGFKYLPIDDDKICRGVFNISPESLFNKPFEVLTVEEISKLDGVTNVKTVEDGIVTPRAYATVFNYEGWNNDNITITIYHEDKDMIDLTSEARIYIHPSKLRENGIYRDTDVK